MWALTTCCGCAVVSSAFLAISQWEKRAWDATIDSIDWDAAAKKKT